MEKVNICPQPLYTFTADPSLTEEIKSLVMSETYTYNGNRTNYTSVNNRLQKKKQYKRFVDWVENTCLKELKELYNYECDKLSLTQMWSNRSEYKNWHHGHTHPYSYVSGIFYVTKSNSNTWFSFLNHWCSLGKGEMKIDRYLENEHQIIHKEPSVPGKLIIFPSNMYHSVDEHLIEDSERYTLSFNAFPSGKVGNFFLLSGLDLTIN